MSDLPEPAGLDETRQFVRQLLEAIDSAAEELRSVADSEERSAELQRRLFSIASSLDEADGFVNARMYGRTEAHVEGLRSRFAAPSPSGPAPRLDTDEEIQEQIRRREESPEWRAALEATAAIRDRLAASRPVRPPRPPRPSSE